MKVLIGTRNEGKIKGAENALKKYFDDIEIEGIAVGSEVSEQPVNDEIYLGAKNRVENLIKYARENAIDADMYLGIEAGISNQLGRWCNYNIAVIRDKNGYESMSVSPAFPIPEKYLEEIKSKSLGAVMDELFSKNNLNTNVGGIRYLTKGEMTRIDLTEKAFIMALIPYINNNWKD